MVPLNAAKAHYFAVDTNLLHINDYSIKKLNKVVNSIAI